MVERSRLQIDIRKWYAAKTMSKKYGERFAHGVSGPGWSTADAGHDYDSTGTDAQGPRRVTYGLRRHSGLLLPRHERRDLAETLCEMLSGQCWHEVPARAQRACRMFATAMKALPEARDTIASQAQQIVRDWHYVLPRMTVFSRAEVMGHCNYSGSHWSVRR